MVEADRGTMRTFTVRRDSGVMRHGAIDAAGAHKKGGVTNDCQVWENWAAGGSALELGLTLSRVIVHGHHRAMVLPRATAASGKMGVTARSKGGCHRHVAE